MIWWTAQPSRARAEQAAIVELAERSPWLSDISWRLEGLRLVVDFTIRHLDQTFELMMIYPSFFPDTVPQVKPRGEVRLSRHQYGAGGEFCLEFRPDNWDPSWTGAMMIESAYRLLSGEAPQDPEAPPVPDAHRETLGQSVRARKLRFPILAEQKTILDGLPACQPVPLQVTEHVYAGHWIARLIRIGGSESPLWSGAEPVAGSTHIDGYAMRLPEGAALSTMLTRDSLRGMLASSENAELLTQFETLEKELFFLVYNETGLRLVSGDPRRDTLFDYAVVVLPARQSRLPAEYADLPARSVAVIGCGSVGSKVAVSLARAGIGKFVLVDGDVLTDGNLIRNDLDGSAIGIHKADALATRLANVNPGVETVVRNISLGDQESSAATDYALGKIAACDLIIEATADPEGFNFCASVARRGKKPMIWAEVFAGGIGGIIARVRPGVEPPPHVARRQIGAWCDEYGVPWERQSRRGYDLDSETEPLIADDADVTVVAAHLTRFALDTLLRPESSLFAHPAYAIGLKPGWIFTAPFETFPIGFTAQGEWGQTTDSDLEGELNAMLTELFPQLSSGEDEA